MKKVLWVLVGIFVLGCAIADKRHPLVMIKKIENKSIHIGMTVQQFRSAVENNDYCPVESVSYSEEGETRICLYATANYGNTGIMSGNTSPHIKIHWKNGKLIKIEKLGMYWDAADYYSE